MKRGFRFLSSLAGMLLLMACTGSALCQAGSSASGPREAIHFPTSGSPDAQKMFLIGVRLLHDFEYEDAIRTFRDAIEVQPDFGMAYWGLAMSYNHPLWGEQDMESARRVLSGLDSIPIARLTSREKGFLAAVKILYGQGDKSRRDTAYAEAMRGLHERYPDDDEVASFYGLALLGTRAENQDFLVTIKASDVLERVYLRNPDHPGVLHYLIHCYDDPRYASLGLRAAERYGRVAAGSAHALHMPSHIYLDQGMWKAFVDVNEASWAASIDRIRRNNLGPGDYDIHALHTLLWLEYGYLQQGRSADALSNLRTMEKIHAINPSPMVTWYFGMMRAAYIVDAPGGIPRELRRTDSLALRGIELTASASDLFATGLDAVRARRPNGVRQAMKAIDDALAAVQPSGQADAGHHHASFFTAPNPAAIAPARVARMQLEALQGLAEGKVEAALAQLQIAVAEEAKLPVGYGPPVPVKPSAELLGEVYLLSGHPQNAMRSFQLALLRYPGRTASLVGLGRAASLAGDREAAAKAAEALTAIPPEVVSRIGDMNRWPCRSCRATGTEVHASNQPE